MVPSPLDLNRAALAITREAIAAKFDRAALKRAQTELRDLARRGLDPIPAGGRPRACREGCAHCCSFPAYGSPLDAAALAEAILDAWPAAKLAEFKARLDAYCADLAAHQDEGYRRFRGACPLLENDRCLAYENRPLSCRSLASPDAAICALWKSTERVGYRPEAPNKEDERGGAIAEGIAQAFRDAGIEPRTRPIAFALRDLLAGLPVEEFLSGGGKDDELAAPPWRKRLEPEPDSPPRVNPFSDPSFPELLERMANQVPASYFSVLRTDSTRDLILRMSAPQIYRTFDEQGEALERLDGAVEDALASPHWNSAEAFGLLPLLNTVRAGYLPVDLKPWMQKVGRLMCDRVGQAIAPDLMEPLPARKPGKTRVCIASNNIRAGSPASWTLGWVKNFDRTEFEVTVINLDGEEDSESYRFKDAADRYLHLTGDPLAIARYMRSLDFDYLIYPDLGDGGGNFRFALFRLARRQAAGWGCPFTTGLPTLDDYLSSDLMEPTDADSHYSEKLVRLPGTGLTYETVPAGLKHRTRASFGLPDGHLILLGQYVAKWLPQHDEMLAEISRRSRNPLVLIANGSPFQMSVLRSRLDRLGVRVLAMRKTPLPVYLRILQLCSVSLDAPDFSGGHTTLQALQVGTPVATLAGEFMRARQGRAFVRTAGAPDLEARDKQDLIDLVTNPERLDAARRQMRPDALFGDLAPLRALESRIRETL